MVSVFTTEYRYIEEQVSLLEDLPYNGDLFLESLSPKEREKTNHNLGIIGNIGESIRRIISSILKLIEKIIKSLLNYTDYLLLSKDDKNRFNRYCAYIDSHSGLKKQKITVRNWKLIESEYKKAEDRAKKVVDTAVKENKSIDEVTGDFNQIFTDLSTVVNAASVVVTADLAKSLASESTQNAKMIETILATNREFLENMDTVLGEGSSKKLVSKVHNMTQHTFLRKFNVMLCSHKKKTLEGYMKEMTNALGNLDTNGGKLKIIVDNPSMVADAIKLTKNKEVLNAGKRLVKNRKQAKELLN